MARSWGDYGKLRPQPPGGVGARLLVPTWCSHGTVACGMCLQMGELGRVKGQEVAVKQSDQGVSHDSRTELSLVDGVGAGGDS